MKTFTEMAREHRDSRPAKSYPTVEQSEELDAALTRLAEVGGAGEEEGLALFIGMSQGSTSKRLAEIVKKADPDLIAEVLVARLEAHTLKQTSWLHPNNEKAVAGAFDPLYAMNNAAVDFHKQYAGHILPRLVARADRIKACAAEFASHHYTKDMFDSILVCLEVPPSKEELETIAKRLLAQDPLEQEEGFSALVNLAKYAAPLADVMLLAFERAAETSKSEGHSHMRKRRPVEGGIILFNALAAAKVLGTTVPVDLTRLAASLDMLIRTNAPKYIDKQLGLARLATRVKKIKPPKKPLTVEQITIPAEHTKPD